MALMFVTSTVMASVVYDFDLSGFNSPANITEFDDLVVSLEFADGTDFNSVGLNDILGYDFIFGGESHTGVFVGGNNIDSFFFSNGTSVSLALGGYWSDHSQYATLYDNTNSDGWVSLGYGWPTAIYYAGLEEQDVQVNNTSPQVFVAGSTGSSVVPEPSILTLMGLGIFGLGLSRRKMKK